MTDQTDDEASAGKKGLEAATNVVNSAAEHVAAVGQHIKEKAQAVKQPKTYVTMLEDMKKAAPIGMLVVAFIGGMIFARRR